MSAHPLNKECVYCVRHANDCNGRAACMRCFSELPRVGTLAGAADCAVAYEAWQARTEESVQEELTRAVDAQQDEAALVELTWQFIKANPMAPFEQARATVEAFIAWRDSRRKQLDARVEELHKEWRSFKGAA